ncbi:MAG: 16S rRNA processing protein RimM [Bdellovibrionaceae bacterium]|nr:16S rRNA processing protein RimM [Pseudobdellovibrionaceae bacterium]|tara:strand:+ start:252 stop:776 length:525 start_codon:yes stop_codon:yes gene_type:complete
MKNTGEWKQIGKVKLAHGLRGEVYVLIFTGTMDWLEGLKKLKLMLSDSVHTIKTFKPYKKGLLIKIPGVDDRNASEALVGQLVSVPLEYLEAKDEDEFFLREVIDFRVQDSQWGDLGVVTGFGSNGVQDLLWVDLDGERLEVPLIDSMVPKIDFNSKCIQTTLPDGMLEFRYEI